MSEVGPIRRVTRACIVGVNAPLGFVPTIAIVEIVVVFLVTTRLLSLLSIETMLVEQVVLLLCLLDTTSVVDLSCLIAGLLNAAFPRPSEVAKDGAP